MGPQPTFMIRMSHRDLFLGLEPCSWRLCAVNAHARHAWLSKEENTRTFAVMDYFYSAGADALHVTLEQWRNQKDSNSLIQTLELLYTETPHNSTVTPELQSKKQPAEKSFSGKHVILVKSMSYMLYECLMYIVSWHFKKPLYLYHCSPYAKLAKPDPVQNMTYLKQFFSVSQGFSFWILNSSTFPTIFYHF